MGNLGKLARSQGRYEEARGYYEELLKINRELKDKKGMALTLHHLAVLASKQGLHNEAKKYFERSLKIEEELWDISGIAITLHGLGILADDLNKPELAFRFTAIAFAMFASMEHADTQKAVQNLISYAQKLGFDEEKAEAEFKKVVQEFNQRGYELIDELLRELEDAVG